MQIVFSYENLKMEIAGFSIIFVDFLLQFTDFTDKHAEMFIGPDFYIFYSLF